MEDKLSNILQNATVDMSTVNSVTLYKKVRFKDDNEVRWITSPNANTEYTFCEDSCDGKKFLSVFEESKVAFISLEEILNANREPGNYGTCGAGRVIIHIIRRVIPREAPPKSHP
nr:hypothetical protein BaRGS_006591 [Batillaria attramentaria]